MIVLSELSYTEKDKHQKSLKSGIEATTQWTYVWNRNTLMDLENRLVASKPERIGEEETEVKVYKLECMEWMD